MRFIADSMLGTLAKALRLLGFDVAYDPFIEDRALIEQARAEGRVILTRDTGITRRTNLPTCVFVESDHVGEQLAQVARETGVGLRSGTVLSRCIVCNGALEEVVKQTVREQVAPYVYATQERFARCPGCGRIYWRGTHVEGMERKLKEWGLK
ncbi:MAG: Mut7-C RNAse domain-containing protein [Armatimonadota bacterium]|nr:MAG: Mut7-C RNAse domain-containing protein [Armatimonadota bacterium]